ncbi:NAD(P)H-quinone oxidoreductase subunit J [Botrimarina colliarenosi]|uniref:NADH-quinone oxidoreductase subunit C n=1 Tax=Botrimarina colliarenosi TaxID=2528001 RepID=A0A5C6A7N1_9BACT|nr:NADH-quinone oxidoreductase subunit C [Botrimarina colliarenosi]TWT96022.1 NAD(P)H-quinone oxidoreductase subunit J [Botrimarina colliarenosi]
MTHDDEEALSRLQAKFGDGVTAPAPREKASPTSDPWLLVETPRLAEVARFLRNDPASVFDCLNSVTVVDYLPIDKKLAAAVGEERLEVVYHLTSLSRRKRLTLKVVTPRSVDGGLPEVPSVAGIWKTADWQECEAYDLSGVRFTGHPNLRRLLCPEDWEGHPLRKDYAMPLEYHGIRGR